MAFLYILYGILSSLICVSDFLFYRIPNLLVAGFLGLLTFQLFAFWPLPTLWAPMLCFFLLLGLGFLGFRFRVMGAGDAKFLAVTGAWAFALGELVLFLLLVSSLGAVIGLIYLKFGPFLENLRQSLVTNIPQKYKNSFLKTFTREPEREVMNTMRGRQIMPYGVAIGLGCLILIIMKLAHHEL